MKILYFYQYFTTPKGSYGTRVYEFAKNWVDKGHEVTVITSVFYKSDITANRFIDEKIIDGIKVKIINININNKQFLLRRIFTFFSFSLISIYFALTEKFDIVITSSPPISIAIPGLFAKIFRNKPLVFEVRDLWPEAPIKLGYLKGNFIKYFFYAFESFCYKKSDLIIALSPGMKSNIKKRFPNVKIKSITNSANFNLFNKQDVPVISELNNEKKYAIYNGNIGPVNNSELLYRAAVRLNQIGRDDIVILLIGDGQLKDILYNKSKNIYTIMFLDMIPKKDLVNYIKNSFVSLIPLANVSVLDTSSPNKLFESMAASIPIIQTTNGWIKEMIQNIKCGYTVDPDDEKELVEKLIYLADNEDKSKEMGKRGNIFAKSNFEKNKLSLNFLKALEDLKNK
tara:strand:- start:2236 stop:3429 length:1194 start_codon:yes stop_codon:yes gene_type:complete